MLIRFANIPVIFDEKGRTELSVVAWALWLKESQERSAGTVYCYVNAVSLFYDFISFYDYFECSDKNIEHILTQFKIALRNGLPELGWTDHSNSYVANVLTAVSLYLDYADLHDISFSHQPLSPFAQKARKAKSFLGHIKPGKIARMSQASRQRNVRVGVNPS